MTPWRVGLREWPVTAHLTALALSIAVPVLAVAGVALWHLNRIEQAALESRVMNSTRALLSDLDRQIAALITTGEVLATSPLLRARNFTDFERQVREAVSGHNWYVVLADPSGQQILNSLASPNERLPKVSNIEGVRRAIDTRAAHVSNLFVGAVAKRPIMTITLPVIENGRIPYVLLVAFTPDQLLDNFESIGLERGWVGSILDRDGTVVGRSEDNARWLGSKSSAESISSINAASEGVRTIRNSEGVPMIRAWQHSTRSGLVATVAVPAEILHAQLRLAWVRFVIGACFLLAVAGSAAYLFGREIATPITSLRRIAEQIAERPEAGDFPPTRLREANEVAAALMHASRKMLRSEARYRTLAERARDIVLLVNVDGTIVEGNPAAAEAYGYTADELAGMPARALRAQEGVADMEKQFADAMAGSARFETVHKRKDGTTFPVEVSAAAAQVGNEQLIFSIVRDISERKKTEQVLKHDADHIRFLMRELSHRSKNLLAVIQAMARQTSRSAGTVQEFERRFEARIAGLARSHDLLVQENWEGVQLAELVQSQLAPFLDETNQRLIMQGEQLRLHPEAAHNLGLALHELATNASKYGALSNPSGQIEVTWALTADANGPPKFSITWTETGGPAPGIAKRKGFGRQVIERLVPAALNGEATLTLEKPGLVWRLEVPGDQILIRT